MAIRPLSNNPPPRAQDFSISKLNIRRDVENAKVSIGQNSASRPLTSINRLSAGSGQPITSINRPSVKQADEAMGSAYGEKADDYRYAYVRRLIAARKAKEEIKMAKAGVAKAEKIVYAPPALSLKTGAGFKLSGATGVQRRLYRMWKEYPASYRNLSAKDRKYFLDLVKPHAQSVRAGVGLGRLVRRDMKLKVERDRRTGTISYEDARDFKKMIEQLPH